MLQMVVLRVLILYGDENTFVLDAGTEFDFFGFSYDPSYTDDSEVVVLQGSVGSGTRYD